MATDLLSEEAHFGGVAVDDFDKLAIQTALSVLAADRELPGSQEPTSVETARLILAAIVPGSEAGELAGAEPSIAAVGSGLRALSTAEPEGSASAERSHHSQTNQSAL